MNKYNIPESIEKYIQENEFWEKTLDNIELLIEKTKYKGNNILSFQLSISIEKNGFDVEKELLNYISARDADLIKRIRTDSESAACVIWTGNQRVFETLVDHSLEYMMSSAD